MDYLACGSYVIIRKVEKIKEEKKTILLLKSEDDSMPFYQVLRVGDEVTIFLNENTTVIVKAHCAIPVCKDKEIYCIHQDHILAIVEE